MPLTDIGVFPVSLAQAQEYQTALHFQDHCKNTQNQEKKLGEIVVEKRVYFLQEMFSWVRVSD